MNEVDIKFKEESVRESCIVTSLEKLFDSMVKKCPNKCDSGYIREEKKISSLDDIIEHVPKSCSCIKKYNQYKRYLISGIPQEFWQMKDADLQINRESKLQLNFYIEKLEKVYEMGYGILFLGGPEGIEKPNSGSGKTCSAIKILENALSSGRTAHYITMHGYYNMVYKTLPGNDNRNYYMNLIDEIDEVDFLCIDELGKISKTGFRDQWFEDMIRERTSHLLVTILITNMNEDEIEVCVGKSIMDILKNNMMKVVLTGDSFRAKKFLDFREQLRGRIK